MKELNHFFSRTENYTQPHAIVLLFGQVVINMSITAINSCTPSCAFTYTTNIIILIYFNNMRLTIIAAFFFLC